MTTPIHPYDYAHRSGIEEISWERFVKLSDQMVESLAPLGIQAVIGMARAGLFPATRVACALCCDLYPIRVTRRSCDKVVTLHPQWKQNVSSEVCGKVVAVIDEIADTGESLSLVAKRAKAMGAASVVTAVLVSHSWASPKPELSMLESDALIIFPWDHSVYIDGAWQIHPEIKEAIQRQKDNMPPQEGA